MMVGNQGRRVMSTIESNRVGTRLVAAFTGLVGAVSLIALTVGTTVQASAATDRAQIRLAAQTAMASGFEQSSQAVGADRQGIDWSGVDDLTVRGRNLDVDMIRAVYEANDNQPLWSEDASLHRQVYRTLQEAHAHGLIPSTYFIEELAAALSTIDDGRTASAAIDIRVPEPLASVAHLDLELLMTAGVAAYIRDIHIGRVAPRSIDEEFDYDRRTIDVGEALLSVAHADDPRAVLESYAPASDAYADLVGILAEFRSLARDGGWPKIDGGGVIRPGERDSRIPLLRDRLAISGDYTPSRMQAEPDADALSFGGRFAEPAADQTSSARDGAASRLRQQASASPTPTPSTTIEAESFASNGDDEWRPLDPAIAMAAVYRDIQQLGTDDPSYYDDRLAAAIERFQRRHGLTVDGVIGPKTLNALNVPIEDRIEQVVAGMERWRWLPRDLSQGYGRHIMVNLAGFTMDIVEDGDVVRQMDTVVGQPSRQTPLFSSRMTWLEFNPTWTIPVSIAVRDMLPNVQRDPDYFRRMGITVYSGWQNDSPALNDEFLDWHRIGTGIRQFRLVQSPGPQNSLGKVKFMMANNFSVYLHDTPARHLFDRTQRAYSSGCIRVEDPMWLADYVMGDQAGWSGLRARMQSDWETRRVNLENHVPVHLAYHTVWRGDDNSIQVREDIYEIDRAIGESLIGQGAEGDRYALIVP